MSNKNQQKHTNDLALEALIAANDNLIRERRKTGESLIIWRDGKVCEVPASELDLPEDLVKKAS